LHVVLGSLRDKFGVSVYQVFEFRQARSCEGFGRIGRGCFGECGCERRATWNECAGRAAVCAPFGPWDVPERKRATIGMQDGGGRLSKVIALWLSVLKSAAKRRLYMVLEKVATLIFEYVKCGARSGVHFEHVDFSTSYNEVDRHEPLKMERLSEL
jgi:hypothetical protein